VLYFGNEVQEFVAVHGIVKMLLGIAKCTGSIGEHVASKSVMVKLGSCHRLQIQHEESVDYK